MAVELKLVKRNDETNDHEIVAKDLATNSPVDLKNWFEKSKNKWHIVLGQNSANRKFISHNEFFSKINDDGIYIVEDKTTPPRVIGTKNPDDKLLVYATDEEKELYENIINKAREEKEKVEGTEEEKLLAKIERAKAELEALKSGQPLPAIKKTKITRRPVTDYISEEDQDEYLALIEKLAERKANAPKPERKPRNKTFKIPKTVEEQEALLKILEERLQTLKAAE